MKLATLMDGSRDGQLVVVSRDLMSAHYATGIANHLQQVLQDWNFYAPQLQDLYDTLNFGKARHGFAFDPHQCLAPLPRAYLLARGDAYVHHGETAAAGPLQLMFSDDLKGPCAPLQCANSADTPDFEADLAVVTGHVAQGASAGQALDAVRLLMLASHTCLQTQLDDPMAGPMSSSGSAFSPVAVTLDELTWSGESAWANGRLNLTLQCSVNGRKVGLCDAGVDMVLSFGDLMAQLVRTRSLHAGSIICSGEVRNLDASRGCCSIAARRAQEMAQMGTSKTPWLAQGDQVAIDVKGRDGQSVFGAIEQVVHIGPRTA